MKKLLLVLAAGTLILAGCGFYSLAGSIPPHIKTVAIPMVENQTAEFGIVESVTQYLQNRFVEENILRLVDEDQADSILRGTITRVDDKAATFTGNEVVTEYEYSLTLAMEWYDVAEDAVLLNKTYTGRVKYGLSGDIGSDGIDNDGDNLVDGDDQDEVGDPRTYSTQIAVELIAEDIINDIMSAW